MQQYYEAVIQIRPRKAEVEKFVETSLKRTDKASLSKRKIMKEGIDYYVSSWRFGVSLGNTLLKQFGGKLTISRKIFGRSKKKGKVVYRSSVLLRLLPFDKGDVIVSEGKILLVTSTGKFVTGKNLLNDKREKVDIKKGWEVLESCTAVVSNSYPNLEIINPEDYQSVAVENAKRVKTQKVRVVVHNDRAYLIG